MLGMRIYYDANALQATTERLFPVSKNRSKRIYKKLVKRHGGEFKKKPCIFRFGDRIVAHPIYQAQIEASIGAKP